MGKKMRVGVAIPPTATSSFRVLLQAIRGRQIDMQFWPKLIASGFCSLFFAPFRQYERWVHHPKLEQKNIDEAPVFIIGHWRSGTTHLHNLMCQDQRAGFVDTYHSVFPEILLSKYAERVFRSIMQLAMPSNRVTDFVDMHTSYPQEEEFALGNLHPYSLYYFWYFPKNMQEYYDRAILFKGVKPTAREEWKKHYQILIKKALINTQGRHFVSKNPPNTGRIPLLLELFPNARFIYIYRNPIAVFLSTRKFFSEMMHFLRYHKIDLPELEENIFQLYLKILDKYEADKQLIPPNQLFEIQFEHLEKQTVDSIANIYEHLGISDFDKMYDPLVKYVNAKKSFQKNKHQVKQATINQVIDRWGKYMDKGNYDIPEHLKLVQ